MAYVQSKPTAADGLSTTIAATFTSNVTAGNVIVVGVSWDSAAEAITSCADGLGNTYNLIGAGTVATNNNQSFQFRYAQNITGGACTVTVTFLGSRDFRRLVVAEYSGRAASAFDQSQVTDSAVIATGADGCVTDTSITPTQNNEDIVAIIGTDTTLTISAGTGFTEREEAVVSSVAPLQIEDLTQTTAAAVTGKWTASAGAGREFCATVLSLKAGAADTGLAWITA